MISGGEGKVVVLPELPCEGGCELGATIGDDFIEQSETKEDFVEKEGCNPFGGDGFLGRAKNYPFSKPMVYHDHKRIEAGGDREISDQIARDLLEGSEAMDLIGERGGTVGCMLTLFCWQRAQPST